MHSAVFNMVTKLNTNERISEDEVFVMMDCKADDVMEMDNPKVWKEEMENLLETLKKELPNTKLTKDWKENYILRLSMKDVKNKIYRLEKNVTDNYGYMFVLESNLLFSKWEWFNYLLTKYAEDAVVEFVVLQFFDYHF